MSPSHNRHSPPALSDDDIVSVFLRITPDDPARLVRASLVCKAWRRILTGPDFCRLYREFHGAPPMLGFIANFWSNRGDVSRFVPTTAFRPPSGTDSNWKAVDSRHGRILIEPQVGDNGFLTSGYIVWDPITNGRWGVPFPAIQRQSWTGAVLCAKKHCDHLCCHGPPFLVTMVGSCDGTTSACLYSSESGMWSDIITLKQEDTIDWSGRSILVGNTLYFPYQDSFRVLQYKLGEQKLSVIDVPEVHWDETPVFVSAEDSAVVFADLRGTKLFLWSAEDGALAWVQRKVIELEKLLPPEALEPEPHMGSIELRPSVCGFTEGIIFLNTIVGLFTVELNSGRTKKVSEVKMANVIRWISFYTQDHARRMMPQL
ncbi:unnamed protein product [Alopecurus aequalis]